MIKCTLVVFLILLTPIVCMAENVFCMTNSTTPYIVEIEIFEFQDDPKSDALKKVVVKSDSYVVREMGISGSDIFDLKSDQFLDIKVTVIEKKLEEIMFPIILEIYIEHGYSFTVYGRKEAEATLHRAGEKD